MMYSEFAEAVGCKDNDHNHKVFRDLEIMYMNSDMSKAEIYEYGKKLVDNSKSEAELKVEAEVKEKIAEHKAEIEKYKGYIVSDTDYMKQWKEWGNTEMAAFYRRNIASWKEEIRYHKNQIAALKWVLA